MSIEVEEIEELPEGTFNPSPETFTVRIFRTVEGVRKTPPEYYRIIKAPSEIHAARLRLTNGPDWFQAQAQANNWTWDTEAGRIICVEMNAL